MKLVVVGGRNSIYRHKKFGAAVRSNPDIVFPGYVTDEELSGLYRRSEFAKNFARRRRHLQRVRPIEWQRQIHWRSPAPPRIGATGCGSLQPVRARAKALAANCRSQWHQTHTFRNPSGVVKSYTGSGFSLIKYLATTASSAQAADAPLENRRSAARSDAQAVSPGRAGRCCRVRKR